MPSDRSSVVATRLRMLRAQHPEITQAALAEHVGVSQNAVHRWETGVSEPRAEHIAAACDLFRCSADYLIGRTESPTGLEPGQWLLDLDAIDRPEPGRDWAVQIPRRHRIVDGREKERIKEAGTRRPKNT
jgi:transcriptional regulator with XRE-family HTH domain